MDFEETIKALAELEGRAVEVDTVLLRPAPGAVPGIERCPPGILRRMEPWEVDDFPWTLPEGDAYFEHFPTGWFVLGREPFGKARRRGEVLEIDANRAIRYRVVPLVRADGCDTSSASTNDLMRAWSERPEKFGPGQTVFVEGLDLVPEVLT